MLNITKPANTSRKGLSLDVDNVVILEKRLFHSITLLINVAQKINLAILKKKSPLENRKGRGTKNHFGFLLHAQNDTRREQSSPFGNKPKFSKIKEQFSEIPSYFSELNTSVPTSFASSSIQFVIFRFCLWCFWCPHINVILPLLAPKVTLSPN